MIFVENSCTYQDIKIYLIFKFKQLSRKNDICTAKRLINVILGVPGLATKRQGNYYPYSKLFLVLKIFQNQMESFEI